MKTETKILGIILFFTLALIFGAVFLISKSGNTGILDSAVSNIDYSQAQKTGTDSAKGKLVEYSDFQCPACLAFQPVIKDILSRYQGQVQLFYKHFPLPTHVYSSKAAYVAEAAGEQGKFWELHDKLFETQSQWSVMKESEADSFFLSLARELELNEDKVREALTSQIFKSKVDGQRIEGQRFGVNATPTFYVNGHKANLKTFDDLKTAVDSEINK